MLTFEEVKGKFSEERLFFEGYHSKDNIISYETREYDNEDQFVIDYCVTDAEQWHREIYMNCEYYGNVIPLLIKRYNYKTSEIIFRRKDYKNFNLYKPKD